jgi:teichuronic acid exporter
MDQAELNKKVTKGVFYNIGGALAKNAVSFLISIVLSRLLTPSDFGLVGMATVFIGLAQGLADLGLTSGLIKEEKNTQSELSSVFFFNLGVSIILTVILYSSAGLISKFYNENSIELIIKAISFTFILNSLNSVHNAILYKKLEIKYTRLSIIISTIISGIVGIGLAFNNFGIWSLIISSYVGAIATVGVIWYYSKWRPSFIFSFTDIKKLMTFGIKVFTTSYIDQIYSRLDIMLIGKIFSPATLGYYFRASSLNQLVTKYSSQGLSGIFFPAISQLQGDTEKIKTFYQKALNAICVISFFLTGLLFVDANELILILFGEKWMHSVDYFRILAFSSYVTPLTLIFNGVLLGTGNAGMQLRLEIFKKLLNLLGLAIGLWFGMYAYLWSLVISNTMGLILSFVFLDRALFIGMYKNLINVFKYAIPMIIAIIGINLLSLVYTSFYPIVLIIVNSLVYSLVFIFIAYQFQFSGYKTVSNLVLKYTWNKFFQNKVF